MAARLFTTAALTILLSLHAVAGEIRVASSRAFRSSLNELRPVFERMSGHKVSARYGRGRVVQNYILNYGSADVIILARPLMGELVMQERVLGPSVVDIAHSPLGLGVRESAPKPDTSSIEGFKRALLNAGVIACADPRIGASSTRYFMRALEQLAILDAIKPKLRIVRAEHTATFVVSGDADMAVQSVNELLAVPGIAAVPFPNEIGTADFTFSAGIAVDAKDGAAAKELIQFLTTPAAIDVYKANNLLPN